MSEEDLQLKAQIRQLFWAMGFSTRIDVPMRAFVPPTRSRTRLGVEEYTDLDVLAVGMSPDFRVVTVIADCKTSLRRATERMFWLRGLKDFFGADNAYLVRAGEVPAAVRQLATRLDLSVVAPDDLALLQRGHVSSAESLDVLFDVDRISRYHHALTTLDKRLGGLLEYRQFDYWVYDEHINLQQVIAHLGEAGRHLDPSNRIHCALFCDYAWLFALAIAHAVQHIRRAHIGDIDMALQEYIFGGQLGLREKQRVAAILRRVAGREGSSENLDILPTYYPPLLELITRFVRNPQALMPVMRYAEWLGEAVAADSVAPAQKVFGSRYHPIGGKLLADVCGFLVAAAELQTTFRNAVRDLLEAPGENVAAAGQAPSSEDAAADGMRSAPKGDTRLRDDAYATRDKLVGKRETSVNSDGKANKRKRRKPPTRPGQDALISE